MPTPHPSSFVLRAAGLIFLATLPVAANSVFFDGYTFQSLYGPENLVLSGGNLQVPTTASNYGGATTSLEAGTALVSASFQDSGVTVGPAAELWVQDFAAQTYEGAIGAFSGLSDYYVLFRIDSVSSAFLDTGVARTAGTHTASIVLGSDGSVKFILDNALVETATAAQWGIPTLADVVLTANGSASGQNAIFTSFDSGVPEPSYLPCVAAVLFIGVFVRIRQRGLASNL
jgi:hypothetical protein